MASETESQFWESLWEELGSSGTNNVSPAECNTEVGRSSTEVALLVLTYLCQACSAGIEPMSRPTKNPEFTDFTDRRYDNSTHNLGVWDINFDLQDYMDVFCDPYTADDLSEGETKHHELNTEILTDTAISTQATSFLVAWDTNRSTEMQACNVTLPLSSCQSNLPAIPSTSFVGPNSLPSLSSTVSLGKRPNRSFEDTMPGYSCFDQWIDSPAPSSKRAKPSTVQQKRPKKKRTTSVCLRCRTYKLSVSGDEIRRQSYLIII